MRYALFLIGFLALAGPVCGQDVPLSIEGDTITVVQKLPFKVKAPPGYVLYVWKVPAGVEATDNFAYIEITKAPKGQLVIGLQAVKVDFEAKKVSTDVGKLVFAVGDVPQPVPPTPPDPPKPPEPPAPIPGDGLQVLFVFESSEISKYPMNQVLAMQSAAVKSYLNSHCMTGADGKTKQWRLWDKDVDTSAAEKVWQDAMKRPRQSLPWVIISNGKTGYEGPVPMGTDEMLKLLKKYGGE